MWTIAAVEKCLGIDFLKIRPLLLMLHLLIEILGWIASVLIVGAYFLNIQGRLKAEDSAYIWANLIGGIFFIVNTFYHKAYPSAAVNVIWVIIAVAAILKGRKATQD
jgi:FtsH-binding integral membrane protein